MDQKKVPTDNGAVKQHHRMAEGQKVDGKTLPPPPSMPKTPC